MFQANIFSRTEVEIHHNNLLWLYLIDTFLLHSAKGGDSITQRGEVHISDGHLFRP
jgi:hypothetical protein